MKIWIDKGHGLHYHKEDCPMLSPKNPHPMPYEEVEHDMRGLGVKCIDGRWYRPCPFLLWG